ncbi:MAG: hypothetical protein CSA65_02110 [Proteobacteria bacterium]|nr:MAG: hypothetical protein CSB49_06185 [Pseudomonadota bacterium]PIE19541.1 MAG: hypothetical protein CSA65_02110 [Pseudomonadota bacterium]
MSLMVISSATLAFGGQRILDEASLRIGEGEKIGLIGPNGSGKSTLLKVLLGSQQLDGGELVRARGLRVGYLPQDVLELAGETILRSVLATVPGRGDIEERIADTETALTESDDPDEQMALATQLAEQSERLEHFETHYSERQAIRIILGLGFGERELERPTAELSGGWKMRAALAGLLFQQPDVLLLDEPTNHLDVPSVQWLDSFLADYRNAIVLISHDREFLNRHAQRVISLEPEGLRSYKGNYDAYLEQREAESTVREANQRNQERELKELERFVERFKAKATKARQAQSRARRVKRLQDEMAQNRPAAARRTLSFSFPEVARTGKDVLILEGISKAFGELKLYDKVKNGVYAGDRVAIIGVNGAGKTTLLKLMAKELDPDAGEVRYGANVQLGYYSQHHTELLHPRNTVLDEVRRMVPTASETFVRSVCGAFLFSGDDVDKAVGVLSGGERARVLLARLLVDPGNLLLMDEPTNHLDLASSEALAEALADYGGTLVFVSHNSAFVNRLATKIWDISGGKVIEYPGNLREYHEHQARWRQHQAEAKEKAAAQKTPKKRDEPRPRSTTQRRRGDRPPGDKGGAQERSSGKRKKELKEQKRREAQRRNELSRRTKKLRDEIGKLEGRIAELEGEQRELEPMMADPALYEDKRRFREVLDRFEANRQTIDELYGRWEFRQQELEREQAAAEEA